MSSNSPPFPVQNAKINSQQDQNQHGKRYPDHNHIVSEAKDKTGRVLLPEN
jgi:hypothetical protein